MSSYDNALHITTENVLNTVDKGLRGLSASECRDAIRGIIEELEILIEASEETDSSEESPPPMTPAAPKPMEIPDYVNKPPVHPIELRFGRGSLVCQQITRPDGDVGVIIFRAEKPGIVGEVNLGALPDKHYWPKPGEVTLIFDSREGANVLVKHINLAVDNKFPLRELPPLDAREDKISCIFCDYKAAGLADLKAHSSECESHPLCKLLMGSCEETRGAWGLIKEMTEKITELKDDMKRLSEEAEAIGLYSTHEAILNRSEFVVKLARSLSAKHGFETRKEPKQMKPGDVLKARSLKAFTDRATIDIGFGKDKPDKAFAFLYLGVVPKKGDFQKDGEQDPEKMLNAIGWYFKPESDPKNEPGN